jgi:hypothetical protein
MSQERDKSSTAMVALRRELILGMLLALSLVNFLKGFVLDLQPGIELYFLINYNNGLIRRGLLGHVFSIFFDQSDANQVRWAALYIHVGSCILLLLGLWVWLRTILHRGVAQFLLAIFAVFATSQFLPTQALDIGYLDVYDYLLVLAAAVAILRNLHVLAGALGFIGPFVHEAFVFIWLPLAVLVLWQNPSPKKILVLSSPLIATAIVYVFSTEAAIIAQMAAAPLKQEQKDRVLALNFGQTILSNLHFMLWLFRYYFANFVMAAAFFTFPATIIVLAYGATRKNLHDALALTLATFLPVTILAFAWDLSRYLVPTVFAALLSVLYMQTVRPIVAVRFPVVAACWLVAALGIFVPFVHAYFSVATVVDTGLVPFANSPIGKVVQSSVAFFSRNIGPGVVDEVGTEDPPGTVWHVEENAWTSVWTRRPGTNVFDAVGRLSGFTVTCVLTITRGGNRIRAVRTDCSDGNNLMYAGTISGSEVRGTYPGGIWRATIE